MPAGCGVQAALPKGMQSPSGTPGTQGSAFWLNTEEQSRMKHPVGRAGEIQLENDVQIQGRHWPLFSFLAAVGESCVPTLVGQTWGSSNVCGNFTSSQSSALQHPEALEPREQNSVAAVQSCCETELHWLGIQPWDALLDFPPLEMGEDVPFVAKQHLALCVRPVLPPGLQLLLTRATSLVQELEEAQVPLSLCEEPCSYWNASPWMFRPEFAFSSPTALPLQWEVLTQGGECVG